MVEQAQKGSKTISAPIWDMDTFCCPDQIGSGTHCASSFLLLTLSWCEVGEELFSLAKAERKEQMIEIQISHILKQYLLVGIVTRAKNGQLDINMKSQ